MLQASELREKRIAFTFMRQYYISDAFNREEMIHRKMAQSVSLRVA